MFRLSFFTLSFSIFSSVTFDPNRIQVFQETFTFNQAKVIYDTVLKKELPLDGDIIPPPGLLNHTPLVISNRSGVSSDRLYVIGKGQKIDDLNAFFLEPDLSNGICSLVSPNTNNSAESNISVKLSSLPSAGTNSYFLYVPQMISGRFYISVDSPLYMKTGTRVDQGKTITTIDDPSQTTTKDPNYYSVYQNFEFTLDKNYELYANVSNVDYFSLPLQLSSHTFPSGDLYPTLDQLTVVGYPVTSSRTTLLTKLKEGLQNGGDEWKKLTIPFVDNPYSTSPQTITDLRIIAAKTSIALEKGNKFIGAGIPQQFFDKDYLSKRSSDLGNNSFFRTITDYYTPSTTENNLRFSIFPANNPETTYTLTSNEAYKLELNSDDSGVPSPITVIFREPGGSIGLTTEGLLGGDVGTWNIEGAFEIPSTFTGNPEPWEAEIAKILSTLFTAGFLPYPFSTDVQPLVVNDTFLSQYRSELFKGPNFFLPGKFPGGPWYNVYDQAVHPLLVQTNGVGLGYAFDYDDLLGIAGLLHVRVQSNGVLNLAQPYSVLSIGQIDFEKETLNPKSDFGPYQLTINPKAADSNDILIEYIEHGTEEKKTIPAQSNTPVQIPNVKNAFKVIFVKQGTENLEYFVYPKYQLVHPIKTRYNEEDVMFMNGIVFTQASESEIEISLPPNN